MDDQDRVSQASSVATISYFPVKMENDGKVQTFGKGCQAAKRDPNCPVVIRGWLNKKDSSGLKLWKRRWFVLSDYCLFYYKDSREESVLGSIPLPSYKILFCTPRECKNRKFTFKVVHRGMRSYFFSADTQEDMLGWVRALSQSAVMESDSSLNRRCSSYQDFTQIGGSSESLDKETSSQRHVSRTVSEPYQLTGGRMGALHKEHRGRSVQQRTNSPSGRTPSPDANRRRACGSHQEEDPFPYTSGRNTPPTQAEVCATGSLNSRGQLGSRPHTPVGRVDIRPQDDPLMVPQTLYYTPSSPKVEFKSTPTTPITERWQNQSKPTATYGSVHHVPSGRRPLGKSYSAGAQSDLLPPLPPSSRATHAPHPPHHHHHHHHHHRSHLSVCVLPPALAQRPDPRENPPIRPLESDADVVLTRLCGCDKLLQSLSLELAQLQMDKDSVHCALEVSRLQLEEWNSQGPRAQEEALTQKALLLEELVTIRARMCDVSLEMERVWSQYERMESELSVIRSHLQHICNFGMPQDQSQAQRELWMMEDILAGLKVNRDHFRFLLGLQRHHMFQSTSPHPGSPGSPTERLPMDVEQEPPVRPPLPQEVQEVSQSRDWGRGWAESPYEGIYSSPVEPVFRGGSSQPDLLNVKAQRDASESTSKWIAPDSATQSTQRVKMSEEEQIERMKKNKERMTNRKKPPIASSGVQSHGLEPHEEAPFPLRVTRVVTAVLPTSLMARRVSVEDPPQELNTLLPEQISPKMQRGLSEQGKKSKPPRRLLLDSADQNWASTETHQEPPVKKLSRLQHQSKPLAALWPTKQETETVRAEAAETIGPNDEAEERPPALSPSDPDLHLTPEQREAKLRRVERIRERVIRSAARESRWEGQEIHQVRHKTSTKLRDTSEHEADNGCCEKSVESAHATAGPRPPGSVPQGKDQHVDKSKNQGRSGSKAQYGTYSQREGVAKTIYKTQITSPASPCHASPMMANQKDSSERFARFRDEEEKECGEPAGDEDDGDFSSCDLRAKWFLSTNHWQGFMPLQIPGLDMCGEEEVAVCCDDRPAAPDDSTESMSPMVSESLEKMKENHSLFYKIACDISISDTDITKNEGRSPKPGEEDKLMITESEDPDGGTASDDKISIKNNVPTVETQDTAALNISAAPGKEARGYKGIQQKASENPKRRPKAKEASAQDSSQTADKHAEVRGENRTEPEAERAVAGKSEEPQKSGGPHEQNNKTVREGGNDSVTSSGSLHEGGRVIRSASFGKARMTVLRTSL